MFKNYNVNHRCFGIRNEIIAMQASIPDENKWVRRVYAFYIRSFLLSGIGIRFRILIFFFYPVLKAFNAFPDASHQFGNFFTAKK